MPQLLVRNLDSHLVRRLRSRARAHGVSVEEEHRRILKQALSRMDDDASLIGFLVNEANAVAPDIELPIDRSAELDTRQLHL